MTETAGDSRKDFARNKLGGLQVSELPIAPLNIDSLVLTVFAGDAKLAVSVIKEVATMEFDLIINDKGEIDLPPKTERHLEERIQVRYQPPTVHAVPKSERPLMSRKSTNRNADGRHIDTEE